MQEAGFGGVAGECGGDWDYDDAADEYSGCVGGGEDWVCVCEEGDCYGGLFVVLFAEVDWVCCCCWFVAPDEE